MWISNIHEKILNFYWLRAVQFLEIQCYYLGFLIGLKYETITKIANKIQQCSAEIMRKKTFRRDFFTLIIIIIFSCISLISNSMVSRAI